MKKLILVLTTTLMCSMIFTGCRPSEANPHKIWISGSGVSTDAEIDNYFDYEIIADSCDQRIIVDKNTGVMYYQIVDDSMTPIYNADGSVKIYEDEENN
jgi:hypothetical protein